MKVSERSHAPRVLHLSPVSSHHHEGVNAVASRKPNERSHSSSNCPQTAIRAQNHGCMNSIPEPKPNERSHSSRSLDASRHGIMDETQCLLSQHDSSGSALCHPHGPQSVSPCDPGACPLSVQLPRSCAWNHASTVFRALPGRTDGGVPVMTPLTPPSTISRGVDRRSRGIADEEIKSLRNVLRFGIEIALQVWDPIMSNGREPGNLATLQASQVTPGPWSPTLERTKPLHRDDGRP